MSNVLIITQYFQIELYFITEHFIFIYIRIGFRFLCFNYFKFESNFKFLLSLLIFTKIHHNFKNHDLFLFYFTNNLWIHILILDFATNHLVMSNLIKNSSGS